MEFGKRILSTWAKWSRMGGGTARPRRRSALRVERLEIRQALVGDLAVNVDLTLGLSWPADVSGELIAMDESFDGNPTMAGPLAAPEPSSGGAPSPMGGGVPAPGGINEMDAPVFAPPAILLLDYAWTGNYITVYGQVVDDGPVSSLLVEFGGLLSNVTTLTDDDGWFSVTVEIGQNFGQVTAVATDRDGWTSNVVACYVW